jgi:DNA-binding beta-propeller fold protein YncE
VRRLVPCVLVAFGVGLLLIAAVALASTGALTPKGCVGDHDNNSGGCAQTTRGLEGADSVVVSPDGKSVYAAGFFENAVVIFKRSTATGALIPKGCVADLHHNIDDCEQTAKGLRGANQVVVSDDGKSVYAVGQADNAIVRFDRDTTSGGLTPKGCVGDVDKNAAGCGQTTKGLWGVGAVDVSPDGKSVYTAACCPAEAIARFARSASGALTPKGCIRSLAVAPDGCAQTAPGIRVATSVVVSDDGKSVYATGVSSHAVARFNRSAVTGALTSEGCVADPVNNPDACAQTAKGLDGAGSVAVSGDGKSVYVAAHTDHAIVRFDRATNNGALTPMGCFATPIANPDGCAPAKGVSGVDLTVSPDGKSVYATGQAFSSAITRFDRSTLNGALRPRDCIADPAVNQDGCGQTAKGLEDPYGVAVSGDGKSVYVAGTAGNAVVRFTRTP